MQYKVELGLNLADCFHAVFIFVNGKCSNTTHYGKTLHHFHTFAVTRNSKSKNKDLLLCWKTRTVAPDPLAPLTMELWFHESLIMSLIKIQNSNRTNSQESIAKIHGPTDPAFAQSES